jgi:hypothetical protein
MANPSYLALTYMYGQLLYSGLVPTTAAAVYTVPAATTAKLTHGTICNQAGTNRTVTDAVTTSGSVTLTSATANFTAADVGKTISGPGIATGATITAVTNSTTISLSAVASATGTGVAIAWGWPAQTVTVTLSLLKATDVFDGTHTIISALPVAAGDTISLRDYLDGAMLATGEAVWMKAGAANMVTAVLSGAVSS